MKVATHPLVCGRQYLRLALIMFAISAAVPGGAHAMEVDGAQMPDHLEVGGTALHLNGYGIRTYSILAIHIYTAALYLEHLSSDAEAVIHSLQTKLLMVRFEHAVSAERARKAWRAGFENNCIAPCRLDAEDVERFLAMVPEMHENDYFSFLFTRGAVTVSVNGKAIGMISKRPFAEAMLATFLGPHPGTPELKEALLQGHH
jgi:Chalcone isomerase-like